MNNGFMPPEMASQVEGNIMQKEYERAQEEVLSRNDDSYIYEIDTTPTLNRIYNFWLGKKEEDGSWVDDTTRDPLMNEIGVDKIRIILEPILNPHSFFGDLNDVQIKRISWSAVDDLNRSLMYELEECMISVNNFKPLLFSIQKMIEIILTSIKRGAMKQYRSDKGKIMISRQENSGGMI